MDVTLTVETGRPTGTRPAASLRRDGLVPGVVYGLGSEPKAVTVPWPELRKALTTDAGLNALINLTVDGATNLSVVKELQRDPVRRDVLHVDFLLIDPNATLTQEVPLIVSGHSSALDAKKGIVEQTLYTLTVEARPGGIPNQIEVDASHLELGESIKVGDIVLPEGVTTPVDPETSVAQGSATRSTIILQQGGEGEEGEGAEGEGGEGGEAADAESSD